VGQFRRDFYFRIASCTVQLPALRERPEDVLLLACSFLRQNGEEPQMDDAVREYLLRGAYPGNVRELKQRIARIRYRHVGPGPITAGDIPEDERPSIDPGPREWCDGPFELAVRRAVAMGTSLKQISQATADLAIRIATEDESGNLHRAAQRLGVTDRALQLRRAAQRERPGDLDAQTA
jgi:transcriptional regulator with PAS, ATPase and Fis domain